MKTSEVLRRAKALIPDEDHWWKGQFTQEGQCECPITAIGRITPHQDRAYNAREAFRKAINGHEISSWNDAPERTFEEVVDAFDRAIKIAQEGF